MPDKIRHYYALGIDNCVYIVFQNSDDANQYADLFGGYIACFGGFENAVCIQSCWGM